MIQIVIPTFSLCQCNLRFRQFILKWLQHFFVSRCGVPIWTCTARVSSTLRLRISIPLFLVTNNLERSGNKSGTVLTQIGLEKDISFSGFPLLSFQFRTQLRANLKLFQF
jgi:hypothetical protein